jgi:hypothetical protein
MSRDGGLKLSLVVSTGVVDQTSSLLGINMLFWPQTRRAASAMLPLGCSRHRYAAGRRGSLVRGRAPSLALERASSRRTGACALCDCGACCVDKVAPFRRGGGSGNNPLPSLFAAWTLR